MSVFKTSNVKMKSINVLKRFQRNEDGNFATLAGLSLIVFLGCLAIGVDIANGQSAKTRLQDTTDAVALIAAKSVNKSQRELDQAAKDYFSIKFPGADGSRINIKEVRREGEAVTVIAENNIDTYFSRVYGKESLDIGAQSTAIFAQKAMDVAMVLDTTYSMNGSKLSSLKNAATSFVETIEDQKNDNVRLSVIPFAQYVNVGTSRRNAVWLDVPADKTVTGKQECSMRRDVESQSNCRTIKKTCTNDGVRYDCSYKKCDKTYGEPYEKCSTPKQTYTWNGCVGSRQTPYNLKPDYSGRKIDGLVNVKCGSEIRPLSNKLSSVKTTIKGMSASGETYMPAGLTWGWRALDNREPLTESSKSVSAGVKLSEKALILMTDGENTKSKNGIFHTGSDEKSANKETEALCNSIKNSEIVVYTIAYDVNDKNTKSLLQNCASDNTKYFDAQSSKQLDDAFKAIGEALNELRITA